MEFKELIITSHLSSWVSQNNFDKAAQRVFNIVQNKFCFKTNY